MVTIKNKKRFTAFIMVTLLLLVGFTTLIITQINKKPIPTLALLETDEPAYELMSLAVQQEESTVGNAGKAIEVAARLETANDILTSTHTPTHVQRKPTHDPRIGALVSRSLSVNDRSSSQYIYMRELLAKVIYHESNVEPYKGKVAVGAVVMNRAIGDFSNIEKVVFAPKQFSYFTRTRASKIKPTDDCYKAADEALMGADPVQGAKYFVNLKLCNPSFIKKLEFVERIGDHWFYR